MTLQPNTTQGLHLSEEQFGELLLRKSQDSAPVSAASPAETHLRSCEVCITELAGLRESLSLFREASDAHAESVRITLRHHPVSIVRPGLQSAYWAAAAATVLVVFLLPIQSRRHPIPVQPAKVLTSPATSTYESDEALLDDVNREISEVVPTPMQALADPTSTAFPSLQNPTQRKD